MATEIEGKKISQLTERTELTGDEMIPFAEGGVNGRFKLSSIKDMLGLTERVEITLTSNQGTDDASLMGVSIAVNDQSEQTLLETTWQGEPVTLSVDKGTQYTITTGDVEGYQKPEAKTFTAEGGGQRSVQMGYNACVLTVTVSGLGSEVAAQPAVTVAYGTVSETMQGGGTLKVPYGVQVTVTAAAVDGYQTPAQQQFTPGAPTYQLVMTYTKQASANYITLDMTITDPATMVTGDVNGDVIQWIRQNSHRVVGKKTADGQMTVCRLMDSDGTKYHDGTDASADIKANDVFMRLPKFYYKATELATDKWQIGFAQDKEDDTWKEWDGKDLIGVYEAYVSGSNLYSRSGVASTGDVRQSDFKQYARNRGTGYTLVKWKHHCIMAFLFYAWYGKTNCQAVCGSGTNSYTKSTGQTDALGMDDTVEGGNGDSGSINFWGLENWWGNKYEWMDNIVVDNRLWKITEDDSSVRQVQAGTADGWITKVAVGEHLDMIPTGVGGSDSTGFCDYYYQSSNSSRVVRRSNNDSGSDGGVSCAGADSDASGTGSDSGSRLAFRGEIVETDSVSAFKAL